MGRPALFGWPLAGTLGPSSRRYLPRPLAFAVRVRRGGFV